MMKMRLGNRISWRLSYLTMYLCMLAAYVYVMTFNYLMKIINFLGYDWFKKTFVDHPMAIYIYDMEKRKKTLLYKFRFFDIFINRLSRYVINQYVFRNDDNYIYKIEFLNNIVCLSRHVFCTIDDTYYYKKPVFLMVTFDGVDITNFFNSIYDSFHLTHINYSVEEIVGIMKLDGLIPENKNPNVLKIECVVDDVNLSEIEYTDIIVGK